MDILIIIIGLLVLAETSYLAYRTLPRRDAGTLNGAVFVDTSALIDGRLLVVARSGFIPARLIVPSSVISELHVLADQADPERRQRARHGLDVLSELQALSSVKVIIHDDGKPGEGGVDQRLIELAKLYRGQICTVDFNLNKVASVQGIAVLNINELAGNVRMAFLPGESFQLALSQKGQDSTQAVGYLSDGTMVVVEKAVSQIGKSVEVSVIRSLQTAAGRMIFAKLTKEQQDNNLKNVKSGSKQRLTDRRTHMFEESVATAKPKHSKASRAVPRRKTKPGIEDSLIDLVNDQKLD